jgi:5-methylcytosine-specific restriction endonuclease McrA
MEFIDWCVSNNRQEVVQRDLDKRTSQTLGASISFHTKPPVSDRRRYYREEYLKSEHWAELKAAKLVVNSSCERCVSPQNLDVHHLRYRSLYDVLLTDLMTLCRRCHDQEHDMLEVRQQAVWTHRLTSVAFLLKCNSAHLENLLLEMGITSTNIFELVETSQFKFGVFRTAFSTRPIALLRMSYLIICGKRELRPKAQASTFD